MSAENSRISVLAIEDDPSNASILQEAIKDAGVDLESAKLVDNLQEARSILSGKSVKLILLDPNLGGEYAVAFIQELRRDDSPNKDVYILVITGEPEEIQQACKNAGANDVIGKPYDYDNLVGKIKNQQSDVRTNP